MKIDNKIIRAVLRQIDQDLSNRAVVRYLGISPTTVAKIRRLCYGCIVDIDELLTVSDIEMRRLLGLEKVCVIHTKSNLSKHILTGHILNGK